MIPSFLRQLWWKIRERIKRFYEIHRYYSTYTIILYVVSHLKIFTWLRWYWFVRCLIQISHMAHIQYLLQIEHFTLSSESFFSSAEQFLHYLPTLCKDLIVENCDTLLGIMANASILMSVAMFFEKIMKMVVGDESDIGYGFNTLGHLFILTTLQRGLIFVDSQQRELLLRRCMFQTLGALFFLMHQALDTNLMVLAASCTKSIVKHGRVVSSTLVFMLFIGSICTHTSQNNSVEPWLINFLMYSIESFSKSILSLMIYSLYIIDTFSSIRIENIDDHVYHLRAVINVMQLLFGIFALFNGLLMFFYESAGPLRALLMAIHAYFNIWKFARNGYNVAMRRRVAVQRIQSLRRAKPEELEQFDDVCAICCQEMSSARITACRHFFHEACLKKWLYVKDCCPFCQGSVYEVEKNEDVEIKADIIDSEQNENLAHPVTVQT